MGKGTVNFPTARGRSESILWHVPSSQHFQRVECIPPSNASLAQHYDGRVQHGVKEGHKGKWREHRASQRPSKSFADNCRRYCAENQRPCCKKPVDAPSERTNDANCPEDAQNSSKKNALNGPVIERRKKVLFHDFYRAGNGHAPMASNIVASDESACPPAGTAHKPAQLDIIDHTESQRLIPAKFFDYGGSRHSDTRFFLILALIRPKNGATEDEYRRGDGSESREEGVKPLDLDAPRALGRCNLN